ncbi:DUF6415 family natural product biosynthesis protein [Streptomyces microflavus]|uniref:DUF6415 family natural product biosynthesis protein n=1 Tax=Streptomyces microflavus TaxID=1919 RepID=UPI00381E2625
MELFAPGVRGLIRVLQGELLRDEDLTADLDAVLGASAGPTGVAGAKRQQSRQRTLFRARPRPCTPEPGTLAELGRSVTRLDRMLSRLVDIARDREWKPPYPSVATAIARAERVRALQKMPVGEFAADRAHLRRLAMAASDLLDLLADDDAEDSDDAAA